MKIDPYNYEETYLKWKEEVKNGIPNISKINSELTLRYLHDMEHGLNISVKNKKGSRSYARLNTLREKMVFFSRKFKEEYKLEDITKISEEDLTLLFSKMRKGEICRQDGKRYKSTNYFVKCFKAFWHWHMKINRKNGDIILDITEDLDSRGEKPEWVYLKEEQVKKLCNNAKFEYKVLIMFLFDTGIRSPSELVNIRVSDLYENCKEVNIRDEISKTFGRKIKLMLCSDILRDYIKYNGLSGGDYLFSIKPATINKYLQRLALRVLGDKKSLAGQKYSEITMYDFRHISCCYWLPKYKSESALKYRFGWKKSDKIHYYSEMLGMKDTITEEDLFLNDEQSDIKKELEGTRKDKQIMEEKIRSMEEQMKEMIELVKEISGKIKN